MSEPLLVEGTWTDENVLLVPVEADGASIELPARFGHPLTEIVMPEWERRSELRTGDLQVGPARFEAQTFALVGDDARTPFTQVPRSDGWHAMSLRRTDTTGHLSLPALGRMVATLDPSSATLLLAPDAAGARGVAVPFERYRPDGESVHSADGVRVDARPFRIVLDGEIEGRPVRMRLDTGSRATLVSHALADELLADGRGREHEDGRFGWPDDVCFSTDESLRCSWVFRSRSIRVGEVDVPDVVVLAAYDYDLNDAPTVPGEPPVDVVLGGTFVRHLLLTVDDGDDPHLYVERLSDDAHVRDEGHRVGMSMNIITFPDERYAYVEDVIPGSAAAEAGVTSGDRVLTIDGVRARDLDGPALLRALSGRMGDERVIEFGCEAEADWCSSFAGTRRIVIDHDYLALP